MSSSGSSPTSSPTGIMDKFRAIALPTLTTLSHGSSAFITTFLLIHLTAPALGTLGGSNLASQTMLLGREYYQTEFGEKYLVIAPFLLHGLSSSLKRLLSPHPSKQPRSLRSSLTVSGYTVGILLLPIHYIIHRMIPQSRSPSILSVGPAELDYEFVKVGLREWPVKNWIMYAGLVTLVTFHAVDGMNVILSTTMSGIAEGVRRIKRGKRMGVAVLGCVVPVLGGLWVMSREPVMAFSGVVERYEAVFRRHRLFRP